MKRAVAILLMGMLLFNWVGYRMLISYWENKANALLEAQIDANSYDESGLISIKIPAPHLSSYTKAGQFERIDGQVELGGVQYKYVKRRLFNDSLEFLCIPNQAAMGLRTARDDFFKWVNDLQHSKRGSRQSQHPVDATRNFSVDYYLADGIPSLAKQYFTILPVRAKDRPEPILSSIRLTAEQPPDFLLS